MKLLIADHGVKYTPGGGTVTVTVQDCEMLMRIDIADTGIGISEEERAKIVTRFCRSPLVQAENGAGISLYLSGEILSGESGYIKVSSKPQQGSVFSVF